jgi:hypothetical protein
MKGIVSLIRFSNMMNSFFIFFVVIFIYMYFDECRLRN